MCQHEQRAGKERRGRGREIATRGESDAPNPERWKHSSEGREAAGIRRPEREGGGGGKTDRFSVKCRPASTARSMRTM